MGYKVNLKKLLTILLIVCCISALLPAFKFAGKASGLSVGKTYSGFKLTSIKYIPEVQSQVMLFNHVKSGARLIFLQNEDANKVFSIAFKTPAVDNTGVNHIIEHSVLDGSANYPVKSPFLEMSKRSLNTYLNAYTASDRTVFPVASRNEKDFNNLMSVYLDAVFYPNVLKDKRIFLQEAGHYELASREAELTFKGVVYNEMRGDQSSPDSILTDEINKSLFPDTEYKWNSGGSPEAIPTLTWEKLKETYNKNYNPSNSYIYLYGDIDIEKTLNYINSKYLNNFTNKVINSTTEIQRPFDKQKEVIVNYPIARDADENNKAFLSMNFVTDKITNKDDAIAFDFLNYMLLALNSSPLKKSILANQIGNNVYGTVNNSNLQTTFSIIAENANAYQKDKFKQIIYTTLNNVVKQGFDKNQLDSLVHSYEIYLSASRCNADRGLDYNNLAMSTWINGGDPTQYFTFSDSIEKIKKGISTKYFENLIQKYLLNNKLSSIVVLKPVKGLGDKIDAQEKASIKSAKSRMPSKDIEGIIKQTQELKNWQAAPNSSEAIAKLPSLNVSDIEKHSEVIPMDIKNVNKVNVIAHKLFTNKIVYSDLYFDTTVVPQNKLEYLYLLSYLLGALDTEKFTYTELANQVGNSMGSLSFEPINVTKYKDMNIYYPKLDVSFYTLDSDLTSSFKVIDEIINNTNYDNTSLLKQYIKTIRASLDNNMMNMGLNIADGRLQSYYSESGKYGDLQALPLYKFVVELDNNFTKRADEITKNLKEVAGLVFNKKNLVASVTCDSEEYSIYQKSLKEFTSNLADNEVKTQVYKFEESTKNEGIMSTSQVQYIANGYDFTKLGYEYSGKMLVLKSVLDGEYIWNRVRELGGAYGGAFNVTPNGNAEFLSWSDPNLKETIDIFNKAGDYIKNFSASQKDIDNYVISTIGGLDKPMSPSEKGRCSDYGYFSGVTQQDIQKERDEVLSTKVEDIKYYGDMLSKITGQNEYCVFGNGAKINDNKDIFNSTIDVMGN